MRLVCKVPLESMRTFSATCIVLHVASMKGFIEQHGNYMQRHVHRYMHLYILR